MPSEHDFPLWPDNPTAEDLLGFGDVAAPIVDALKRDRLDPVALGVFGDWGSGKTTVLELVRAELDGDESIAVIYTQPWEYDPATDPKATLIGEVLSGIRTHAERTGEGKLAPEVAKRFKELARRIKWSKAIGLAARSAVSLTPPSFEDVTDLFGKEDEPEQEPTLQGFRDEFERLMQELESISRVVVLVDDLDRCLPPAVVGALEAIKLFLSVPKMGFVIAADERVVAHAIAAQYEGAAQAERLGQQYLEKIVQIPLRVPALGEGDTKAYLALLLLHRHFSDDADGFKAIVEHAANRRAESAPDVLDELPDGLIPDGAKEELGIAAQLAPVLAHRVEGNPRRLKRFMNAYWLRSDIAKRRKAELNPPEMAKLLLLERLDDDGFRKLLAWLSKDELKERLRTIEDAEKKEDLEDDEQSLFDWAREQPTLADRELGPYLRLAASLTSTPGLRTELRSELQELLEALAGGEAGPRKTAEEKAGALPPEDRVALGRELVGIIIADPSRQSDVAHGLAAIGADDQVASEIMARLADFSPGSADPDLIIRIKSLPGARGVIQGWLASGSLSSLAEAAAKDALKEGPG